MHEKIQIQGLVAVDPFAFQRKNELEKSAIHAVRHCSFPFFDQRFRSTMSVKQRSKLLMALKIDTVQHESNGTVLSYVYWWSLGSSSLLFCFPQALNSEKEKQMEIDQTS